ncbi:hypothetical protein [Pantanalinema sp. GBBB05]|uniref:hypothetical protein n=1 Tax=Pantanalinema sp. GBBB05 TaxID=2604139 RepID=UPI001DD5A857|nr:hypothetical protein [Pantanalinema sp. GBBB05]
MKSFDQLTPQQRQIISNLRKGFEIYYPPDSADITALVDDGWLTPIPERSGEFSISPESCFFPN